MPNSFLSNDSIPFSQELQILDPSPGFWGSLPNITNIVYTSVNNAGNMDYTIPFVITSPRKRVEGQPSYGIYRQWKTTFKIDPNVWLSAVANPGSFLQTLASATGSTPDYVLALAGTWTLAGTHSGKNYWTNAPAFTYWDSGSSSWYQRDTLGSSSPWVTSSDGINWSGGSATFTTPDINTINPYPISTVYPKLRDTLVIDSNTWTVFKDVDAPSDMLPRGLWRLCCIRLEIVVPLEDTVQYQQSSCSGSSAAGSRTISFTNIGSPVPSAIQPMTAELGIQFGTKNFGDKFIIYLQSDPSGTGYTIMQAGDLFEDRDNILYEIEGVYDRNRLDALPAFVCEKKL